MLLDELLEAFLYSRRQGTSGAKRQCSAATVLNYTFQLRHFVVFMQERCQRERYEDVTALNVKKYVEYVQASPRWKSKASKYTMLRAVRTLFHFVTKDDECKQHDPALKDWTYVLPAIPMNPRRTNIPQTVDLKEWRNCWNLKSKLGYRNMVAFSMLLVTGMRIGELCAIEMGHLQLQSNLIFVPSGKTGSRLVPVTTEFVRLLERWLKKRSKMKHAPSKFVFISRQYPRCTASGFGQVFRKMGAAMGLKHVTPHTLRHAFCTYYLRNGGSLERLRMITGHTTYKMLLNYLHTAEVGSEQAKKELESVSPLAMLSKRAS